MNRNKKLKIINVILFISFFLPLLLSFYFKDISPIYILLILIFIILSFFFLFGITNPFYVFLFVPIGSYLGFLVQIFKNSPIPLTLFQIFFTITVIVFFFHKIFKNDWTYTISGLEIEFLIFFSIIYFSLIYTPNYNDGIIYATRILLLIFMFYLVINILNSEKKILIIIYSLLIVATILGILSIRQGLLNPQAMMWNYFTAGQKLISRATVTQKDPNILATHFFFPIFYSLSMVMEKKQNILKKILGSMLFALFMISLISTFSRSAWIAVIIPLIIVTILLKQYKLLLWLILLGFISILFIPNVKVIFYNIIKRFYDIFAGFNDASTKIRYFLGIGALKMFLDSFLIGVGFRGFPVVFHQYMSTLKTAGIVEPHNLFYTLLAENGLFGFLIYSWILIKIGNTAYLNVKVSRTPTQKIISTSLFASFLAYIIFYQFYGGGLVDNNFWIIVGIIFSVKIFVHAET